MFSVGACGYGLIEILWRGYTHWSMALAGGFAFLGLSRIGRVFKNFSILIKGIIGGGLITGIEYIFGLIFNIILKKNVWDYSKMPLNIGGQVCALYSFFWIILSMLFIPFSGKLLRFLEKER